MAMDLSAVVLPDPGSTSVAVAALGSAVVADAVRLVGSARERDWAAPSVPEGLVDELYRRAQGSDDRAVTVGPGFYQWYFTLLRGACDGDRVAVRSALENGPGTSGYETFDSAVMVSVPGSTIGVVKSSDVIARATQDYSREYTGRYGREIVIEPLPEEAYEPGNSGSLQVERLAKAIAFISEVWPEAAAALELCTVDIALVTGPHFVGGSDLACYGTSFLGLRYDWSVLCYADHLLHEAAHQAMHAFGELSPPLHNPDTIGWHSPIRADPRPLYGTLHATVVFSWLVELCRRVLTAAPDRAVREEAELRLHRHLLGLYEGAQSLEGIADWTATGEQLRSAFGERVSCLRSEIGEPDPGLYERVPGDYERPSAITGRRDG